MNDDGPKLVLMALAVIAFAIGILREDRHDHRAPAFEPVACMDDDKATLC